MNGESIEKAMQGLTTLGEPGIEVAADHLTDFEHIRGYGGWLDLNDLLPIVESMGEPLLRAIVERLQHHDLPFHVDAKYPLSSDDHVLFELLAAIGSADRQNKLRFQHHR